MATERHTETTQAASSPSTMTKLRGSVGWTLLTLAMVYMLFAAAAGIFVQ